MNKKFSTMEIGVLCYFIIRAFYIGITFNFLLQNSERDEWITILLSIIPMLLYIKFIIKFINYYPNHSFKEKIYKLFKKPNIILIVISIFFLFLSILNFMNLNNLIHSQFLNKTPIIIISLIFLTSIFYILSKNLSTITRVGLILFYFSIILYIITIFGFSNIVDITNLMPVLQTPFINHLKGISSIMAYNIFPLLLISIVPKKDINKKNIFILSMIGLYTIISVGIVTISTFGFELTKVYEYPEFHVLKSIMVLGLQAKVDNILAIQWLFDMYMFIVLSLYFIVDNVKDLVNVKKNIIIFILCIIMLIATIFIYKFNIPFNDIFVDYAHYFINIIFIIFIILILRKIKKQS